MEFNNNSGASGTTFNVPCIVADNLLKISSGEQIKVLLYILRNSGKNITTEEISVNTGLQPNDVEECIKWWQNFNIIPAGNITPQPPSNIADIMTEHSVPTVIVPSAEHTIRGKILEFKPTMFKPTEVDEIISKNPELYALIQSTQEFMSFPSNMLNNLLVWIYEYYGFRIEVITILINYCHNIGITNLNYIEALAKKWYEKGINSMEEAYEETKSLQESRDFTCKIKNLFEMKRNPTTAQQEFIDSWQNAGYDIELIKYAYEITIENIEKLSFPYINKILVSWGYSGINTLEKAKSAVTERKNSSPKAKTDNSDGFDADKYDIVVNNF